MAYTYDDKPETMATSSVIFHGSPDGFSAERSTVLPTYCKGNARVVDLNGDGWLDVVFYNPTGHLAVYHGGPHGFSTERMSRIPWTSVGTATSPRSTAPTCRVTAGWT